MDSIRSPLATKSLRAKQGKSPRTHRPPPVASHERGWSLGWFALAGAFICGASRGAGRKVPARRAFGPHNCRGRDRACQHRDGDGSSILAPQNAAETVVAAQVPPGPAGDQARAAAAAQRLRAQVRLGAVGLERELAARAGVG